MATTVSYSATMCSKLSTSSANCVDSGASQEFWSAGTNNVGIICFSGMNLQGTTIQDISFTVTSMKGGYGSWYTKTAYFRKANYQNNIESGVTGRGYVGDELGTVEGSFYGNTTSFSFSGGLFDSAKAYLEDGNNTFVLYNPNPSASSNGWSLNYLIWSDVTINVTYEEGSSGEILPSQPSTSEAYVPFGSSVTIYTNRENDSLTHTISYTFVEASGTISDDVSDSVTWYVPDDLTYQIPNQTQAECTITCDTYYGSDFIGTRSCTIILGTSSTSPTGGGDSGGSYVVPAGGYGNEVNKYLTVTAIEYNLHHPENNSYNIGIPNSILNKTYGTAKKAGGNSSASTKVGGGIGPKGDDDERDLEALKAELEQKAWNFLITKTYNEPTWKALKEENPAAADAVLGATAMILTDQQLRDHTGKIPNYAKTQKLRRLMLNGPESKIGLYPEGPIDRTKWDQMQKFNDYGQSLLLDGANSLLSIRYKFDLTHRNSGSEWYKNRDMVRLEADLSDMNKKKKAGITVYPVSKADNSNAPAAMTMNAFTESLNSTKSTIGLDGTGDTITGLLDGKTSVFQLLNPENAGDTSSSNAQVQATGQNGGQMDIGKAAPGSDKFLINVNHPIQFEYEFDYDEGNVVHYTENIDGSVHAEDFHIEEVGGLKTKFAIIDILLARKIATKEFYAEKAYIEELTTETLKVTERLEVTIGDLNEETGEILGSALWVTRANITGVCGKYRVEVDPETGEEYLVIVEGGGLKLLKDGVEYGYYHDENLTGGLIVKKINDQGDTYTKILGKYVDITGDQIRLRASSSVSIDGWVENFEGSDLWVQREGITGVCGKFHVETDPETGEETLVIDSGGGMKIKEASVEYGLYHEGNLHGGLISTLINEQDPSAGTYTKILGKVVDIDASQVKVGSTSTVAKWMNEKGIEIDELEGLIADKATIAELNAQIARIETLEVTTGELDETTGLITGSALWTNRDGITGVAGEFDVVTNPDGSKTLVIKSGGGMKIRQNNVEYGIYHGGNLTGGIVVDKINNDGTTHTKILGTKVDITADQMATLGIYTEGHFDAGFIAGRLNNSDKKINFANIDSRASDYTAMGLFDNDTLTAGILVTKINDDTGGDKIIGSRIDISADQVRIGGGNVGSWMTSTDNWKTSTDDTLENYAGLIADKASIQQLYAQKARIDEIISDYITTQNLSTCIANMNVLQVGSVQTTNLQATDGNLNGVSMHSLIYGLDLTSSGNTYTLSWTTTGGTPVSKTFSRATSLSGTWSGGALSITASPQGNKASVLLGGSGSWGTGDNANKYTYNITDSGTWGSGGQYSVKEIEVDASGRYDAGYSAGSSAGYTSGYNKGKTDGIQSVTVSSFNGPLNPSYSNGKYTFGMEATASNGKTGTSGNLYLTPTAAIQDGYNSGWAAAYGKVSLPANGTSASMTVKTPPSTVDGTATSTSYSVSADNTYAYIKQGSSVKARATHSAYSNGYTKGKTDGVSSVTATDPTQPNGASMNTGGKSYNVYARSNASNGSTKDKTFVIDTTGSYNAGWSGCYGTVGLNTTTQQNLGYGGSVTIYAQAKSSSGASSKTNVSSVKITAPANNYDSGYTAGYSAGEQSGYNSGYAAGYNGVSTLRIVDSNDTQIGSKTLDFGETLVIWPAYTKYGGGNKYGGDVYITAPSLGEGTWTAHYQQGTSYNYQFSFKVGGKTWWSPTYRFGGMIIG